MTRSRQVRRASRRTVPVIMLPRYTTLSGAGTYTTLPVKVSAFSSVELAVWRSSLPTGASFAAFLQASSDKETWTDITSGDPGDQTEDVLIGDLNQEWFRVKVTLSTTSSHPVATCYAVGELVRRANE